MNKKILVLFFIGLLALNTVNYSFAVPSLNLTQSAGQTTPPLSIFDNLSNMLFRVTSTGQAIIEKFIQFDNTGLTALRNYRFPDSSGTIPILNVTQTFTGANTFSHNTNTFTATNTGLIISNPAGSFATTLAGGAVTANRTLNLPLQIQTETIAVQPTLNFTTPTNPAATTSTTGVMSNLLATFTPHVTGRALIVISGDIASTTAAASAKFDIRYGTSLIAEGVAIGNTVVGTSITGTSSTANAIESFSNTVQVTGLTVGTKYYIQIGKYSSVGTSTASFTNLNVSIMEI